VAAKARDLEFSRLYQTAAAAGAAAVEQTTVIPMVVTQHANPLDDASRPVKSWYVADGVCGFAWVTVFPGNSPFANWLKKNGLGSKAYGGGVQIWVSQYNQSMQKKEAYASAFAKVLQDAGLKAYSGSRMD
jgi:hypothetical protein